MQTIVEKDSTQALPLRAGIDVEAVPDCYGTMAAKDDDECGVCPVAAACVTATTIKGNGTSVMADPATGEIFSQPTLSDELFPAIDRRQVPMVKIAFSGTVEMEQAEFEAYCDQGLEPGRVVKLTLTGYLPNPHSKWVKRTAKDEEGRKDIWWEHEGQVKVKALELGSFELRGIYDGQD